MNFLKIILLCCLISNSIIHAQTLHKTFKGNCDGNSRTFEFRRDGTYKSTSSGHFGSVNVSGNYALRHDTVQLLSGFANTYLGDSYLFLLDKTGMLIDLNTSYDYAMVSKLRNNSYHCQKRNIKYPQITTNDQKVKDELEKVLNLLANSIELKRYYRFDTQPQRQLLFAYYCQLNAKITVDDKQAIFKPAAQITDPFYIEFEDINQGSDRIDIKTIIHGEGTNIWFTYFKKDGKWVSFEPNVFKK